MCKRAPKKKTIGAFVPVAFFHHGCSASKDGVSYLFAAEAEELGHEQGADVSACERREEKRRAASVNRVEGKKAERKADIDSG